MKNYDPYRPAWWSRDLYRIVTNPNIKPLDVFDWHSIPDIMVDNDTAIAVLTITDGADTDTDWSNNPVAFYPYTQALQLVERSLNYKDFYSWRGYEVIGVIPTKNVRRDIEWLHEFLTEEHPIYNGFRILQDVGDLIFVQRCCFLAWQKHVTEITIQHDNALNKKTESIEALELRATQRKIEFDDEILTLRSELQTAHRQIAALQEKLKAQKTERDMSGYVYLVQSVTGYWKIGRTKNPDDRLHTFGVKLPFEVEYKHLIHTEDMFRLEKDLHTKFADKRVNGEWFDLSDDDTNYICGLF